MMRRSQRFAPALAVVLLTAAAAVGQVALRPGSLVLVDGREIAGQIAHDTGDFVVVYSPRGGTLRSFPKALLHAVTVAGKRAELNPRRDLTDAEKALLGHTRWPDAVPAAGRVPAYARETWGPPRRLLIWKSPGKSGVLHEGKNWIILGGEGKDPWPKEVERTNLKVCWLDTDTDILLPAAEKAYQVAYAVRPAGIFDCRHVTAEHGATLRPATVRSMAGSLWVARGGAFGVRYTTILTGGKHTFFLNDYPPLTPASPKARPVRGGYVIPRDSGPYSMSQYITVRKAEGVSVEFIGTVSSSDDFQMVSGMTIVAPGSQLWPGTRSTQRLYPRAVLRLHSGSEFGKAHNAIDSGYGNSRYGGGMDIVVAGRVEVGTAEYPIAEDVRFGVSFKTPVGMKDVTRRENSMMIVPGAEIVVHTKDPTKARLVICWHRRHNDWFESRLKGYKEMPESITVAILGDLALADVVFDDLAAGGLRLGDPDVVKRWRNVTFGGRSRGKPAELIAPIPPEELKGILSSRWLRQMAAGE